MLGTLSKTFTFRAFLLAPVTDKEVAETDTSFLACGAQAICWQNGSSCYNCNRWSGSYLYLPNALAGCGHNYFEPGSWLY